MAQASKWWISRIGYTETLRAIAASGEGSDLAAQRFRSEWPQLDVIDLDQELAERAAELAIKEEIRTLDALHLASALRLPDGDRIIATWDHRLWLAAKRRGVEVMPERL